MIQFTANNTQTQNISQSEINTLVAWLENKRSKLGFIDIDENINIKKIQDYTKNVWSDFDNIVVLWIGWSALGTKALLESLMWKYYNENKNKSGKNIYVLDNIDPDTFTDLEEIIDISRTLFVFISKSGGTIETLSEYLYFREKCKQQTSNWKKHFCFIVGENCKMRDELEKDFQVFYIPENIGGRFSVFTAVGLLPLAFTWGNIDLFLQWIRESKQVLFSTDIQKNTALKLALTQYKYYQEGKNITVFFPYSSRMFQVGEWYKQLMWESIGKWWEGITLTSSLGVTDQHSQLQLYQDGPQDKFFLTLEIEDDSHDITIEKSISWFTFKKLLDIERYGTETSLQNEWHPLCSLSISILDAKHIAQLLYTFMFQIAYLWELFQINAFDQPWVEKSKIITKQKLQEEFGDIDVFHKAFYE